MAAPALLIEGTDGASMIRYRRGARAPSSASRVPANEPVHTNYAIADVSLGVAVVSLGVAAIILLTRPHAKSRSR